MSKVIQNKPFVFIFTSQKCGHCRDFRGDGNPSNDKEWNRKLIENILKDASSLIEINLYEMNPNFENIIEVNNYKIIDDNLIRYKYEKEANGSISYKAYINGKENEQLSKQFEKNIWDNKLPDQLLEFRDNLFKKDFLKILEKKQNPFNIKLNKIYNKINNSTSLYELDKIINEEYNFMWWLNDTIPQTIMNLIIYYPTWIFISQNEYISSLNKEDRQIYGHVLSCDVNIINNQIDIQMNNDQNSPLDDLIMIIDGKINLTIKR